MPGRHGSASLKSANDTRDKQQRSYDIAPQSVSKDVLDNATTRPRLRSQPRRHRASVRADKGWRVGLRRKKPGEEVEALTKSLAASSALLGKYTIKAPIDGNESFDQHDRRQLVSFRASTIPIHRGLSRSCHGSRRAPRRASIRRRDLIPRLPPKDKMKAQMFIQERRFSIPSSSCACSHTCRPRSSYRISDRRRSTFGAPDHFRCTPPPGVELTGRAGRRLHRAGLTVR